MSRFLYLFLFISQLKEFTFPQIETISAMLVSKYANVSNKLLGDFFRKGKRWSFLACNEVLVIVELLLEQRLISLPALKFPTLDSSAGELRICVIRQNLSKFHETFEY